MMSFVCHSNSPLEWCRDAFTYLGAEVAGGMLLFQPTWEYLFEGKSWKPEMDNSIIQEVALNTIANQAGATLVSGADQKLVPNFDVFPGSSNGDLLAPILSASGTKFTQQGEVFCCESSKLQDEWKTSWVESFKLRQWGMKLAAVMAFGYLGCTNSLKETVSGVPILGYMAASEGWGKFCDMLFGGFLYAYAIEPVLFKLANIFGISCEKSAESPQEPKDERKVERRRLARSGCQRRLHRVLLGLKLE